MITLEKINELYQKYQTPENVILHCQAVAKLAQKLAKLLIDKGYSLNLELINSSALLHDLARTDKNHEQQGALRLRQEGFNQIADIVAVHSDLPNKAMVICESLIVYYADKCTSGTDYILIEERFKRSYQKCLTPQAKTAWQCRYQQAKAVEKIIEQALR